MLSVTEKCRKAKEFAPYMAALSSYHKNYMISIVSTALTAFESKILAANAADLEAQQDKPEHILDRLRLTEQRLASMSAGIQRLLVLPDPIGEVIEEWDTEKTRLHIKKVRVPLGVIGMIYEARPNVTVDAICLAIKTGNTIVLRGSKDAINTNKMLVDLIRSEFKRNGYEQDVIQLIEDTSHESADCFMKQYSLVDVLLPRGSGAFIKRVVENATVPVIETGAGNCHAYVEKSADVDMAVDIILNGKLSRPSVCNALESLLIDKAAADKFLPPILKALIDKGVKVYGCEKTRSFRNDIEELTESDLYAEYGGLCISVKVVDDTLKAIEHINKYGTHHSDVIITKDKTAAEQFLNGVDSAAVYVNASTRFTDGYEFGFGAEMGISTQKLHARGPMGLRELTSYKYEIIGDGQIRE